MTTASNNQFPKVILTEQSSTPSNPSSGDQKFYIRTSDHKPCLVNSSGTVTVIATSGSAISSDTIWDAKGDIVAGTGADAAARVAVGANNTTLVADSAQSAGVKWTTPAGYEMDYVAFTSGVSPTATTEATANTVVTSSSVAYDGSTVVLIEFYSVNARPATTAGADLSLWLYDGSSSIGRIGYVSTAAGTNGNNVPVYAAHRLTPSNASHTYSIRASVSSGTGLVQAGAGGTGNNMPGFIRITKVA